VKVASILDEFSEKCFSHEFNLVRLRQENFVDQINKNPDIAFLLVESAWRGSNKSWCLASTSFRKSLSTLKNFESLIKMCKKKRIPCVFWNKEDPAHFSGFLQAAKYFDYIFTTDIGSKKKYVKPVGHDRIYTLPFAAQPKIHWPQDLTDRYNRPCFAGTYWSKQHVKRAQDMNHILAPALQYGLHIYDRNVMTGCGEAWPMIYRKSIKGGKPYKQLVDMYRKYRLFMNVNCITDSLTMFSRRVFELLACGTPVISAASVGIQSLLPTSVRLSSNKTTTTNFLQKILKDDAYWKDLSFKGIREVFANHTYSHRASYICNVLKLEFDRQSKLAVYKEISQNETLSHSDIKQLIVEA
jgi:glycosyltransferase involved in cell wall biosynthesis